MKIERVNATEQGVKQEALNVLAEWLTRIDVYGNVKPAEVKTVLELYSLLRAPVEVPVDAGDKEEKEAAPGQLKGADSRDLLRFIQKAGAQQ